MSGGRPTRYKKEYNDQVYKLCILGATDKEIAAFFCVKKQTIDNWKKKHLEFFGSIKLGRQQADSDVALSLFKRATGYSHPDEKIFVDKGKVIRAKTTKHYPPDTAAMIYWLNNRTRQRDQSWSNKQHHEVTGKDGQSLQTVVILPAKK